LLALGEAVDRGSGRRRGRHARPREKRKRSIAQKVLTGAVALVALVLIAAAAGYGYLQYRFDQFTKVHVASEVQAPPGQPFNMLVIGSDTRVGLTGAAEAQAGSAQQVVGQRSDVTMIWHVVPATRQIAILSIPRDTLVQMVGSNVDQFGQMNRINASFGSGPNLLAQTIEANFGIPINHVVQVDFGGLTGAVDALGGVWLDFPYPAKDAWSGLDISSPGCQLLNGGEALAVARSRHYQYQANGYWQFDGTSDFGRIQRQDAFLRALVNAAESKYSPLTLNSFLGSLPQGVVIDDQFTLNGLIGLAEQFHSFSSSALVAQTLPTVSDGYVSPWGDVLFVNQPAAQEMLTSIFGSQLTQPTSPPPNTDLQPTPPPQVAVAPPTTAPSALAAAKAAPAAAPISATTAVTATPAQSPPPSFDPTPCTPH